MIQIQDTDCVRTFTNLQDVAAYYAWKHRHDTGETITLPPIVITPRFIHAGETQYARLDRPAQAG